MNSVLTLIEETIKKFPKNIAIDDDETAMTYEQLYNSYNCIAQAVISKSSGEVKRPVLVYLPKSAKSVVSFMGALASANMYVPADYKTPLERLSAMIDNLNPIMIITDEAGKDTLSSFGITKDVCVYDELLKTKADVEEIEEYKNYVIDTDPAYVMYTSGSTGVPKGVVIAHRGIINYALWLIDEFKINEKSVLGLQSGFHFDNSVFDIYTSFFTGAKMVIIPEILFMYPGQLIEFMQKKEITTIFWVPTVMINVANSQALENANLPNLKTVVFAGEVMPNKQLNIWRNNLKDCVYANLYGPTEITVDCTYYIVDREFENSDPLPIGKSVPNNRVLILNEQNKLCEPYEHGELCVAGCGVALGYYNNKELTDKVFVQNPLNDKYKEIIYRTGDIAYKDDEGLIMYVGRRDNQFKLRGNRIELGDIENAASCVSYVKKSCALFDSENEKIILVIESDEAVNLRKLNLLLAKYLPKYMLPGQLEITDNMPVTPNNKIDRKALYAKYTNLGDKKC